MGLKINYLKESDLPKLKPLLKAYKLKPFSWLGGIREDNLLRYLGKQIDALLGDKDKNKVIIAQSKGKVEGLATLSEVLWDSQYFGFKVAKMGYLLAKGGYQEEVKIKDKLLSFIFKICQEEKVKFLNLRVDTAELSSIQTLEENGFHLITTELMFAWDKEKYESYQFKKGTPPCKVRDYREGDLPALLKLAKYFTTNRLYQDSHIPEDKARGVYKEWVKNASYGTFSGNDLVLVGEREKRIVGFTTAKIDDSLSYDLGVKLGVPGLVGVDPQFRGLGISPYIMGETIKSLFRKTDIVAAPSHITNLVMIRSETKTGAELVSCEYTFHKWF